MQVRSGTYDILASGIVIAFRNQPIEFTLSDEQPPVIFRIVFAFDTGEMRLEFATVTMHELTMTLFNTDRELATGTQEPLAIGAIQNRRLYFNYRTYSLGDKSQITLHYTWYLGEPVPDAEQT